MLLYDHQTQSLWSQLSREAVTGPMMGTPLPLIPVVETSWGDWKGRHPDTLVLSRQTGHVRNYDENPYDIQAEKALAVLTSSGAGIYRFGDLRKMGRSSFSDQVGRQRVRIHFDANHESAWAEAEEGETLDYLVGFYRALREFLPRARVYRPSRK